jgi:ion channel-forming bestrophin family protein
LQDYLQTQLYKENIVVNQVSTIQTSINALLESSIGCERILKTPIPIAYSIHLKQLLLLYCLTLPFQFIGQLGYWTATIVFLVSVALLGIEAIGMEIENPFGSDINDINMNDLCSDTVEGIEEIINLKPISPTFQP